MKPLRILVAVPYYPPAIGGVETYSEAIVADLKKQGHAVTVITTRLATTKGRSPSEGHIKYLSPWLKLSNTPINPLWYFQIKKIIKAVKPDVIHVHSPVPFFADMTVFAAKGRIPILMTYHAGSMKKGASSSDKIISFYERHILPRVFRRVDKIGAVLPRFVKSLVDNSAKVVFTPPGIDTNVYKPDRRLKRTTDIIFAGRIETTSSWKGLDVLFHAVSLVKKELPHIAVSVVGRGDAVELYRQLAKDLSIEENVTFITNKHGKQMVSMYQAAKIIALPSKTEAESFGMVLAEAMACGVTPIGSRIGGIPNVINHEENGLLVPPNDAMALCEAILRLLRDTAYRDKLAKKAISSVGEKFTLQDMIRKNTALLYGLARKEIVHVSAYYPPHLGGMELAVSMLVDKLYDSKRRVRVVTSNIGSNDAPVASSSFVKRLRAFEMASTPIMPMLLWHLLRQSPQSIFHVHVAQAGIPEVAFLAAKLKRLPIVFHVHGDVEASSAAGFLLPLYKKVFLGFVLRRAQAVIVPTMTYKRDLGHRYRLKNPVYVVPAGINERFFHASRTKKNNTRFTVLFVGRLTVEKNVDLLIKAVQKVTHPIDFIIVGDGVLRGLLEKLAKESVSADCTISFAGRKTPDELGSYYAQADVLVLASNYESQSLVVLEAMASGTPVVVANVPAVNEIVGEAGILAEKTVDAFCEALTQLIENPDKHAELIKKGKERARQFDWSMLIRTFEDIYNDLEE